MKTATRLVIVFMVFIASFVFVQIANAVDFSADMVSTTKAGTFSGKLYVSGQKARIETPEAITISRMDRDLVWMLIPSQNMYMEQKLKAENVVATGDKMPGEIERTPLGPEITDGQPTDKYRIVYMVGNERTAIFQWIAAASKIPIKMQAEDASWTFEYRNLKVGPQPDALFEIPQGYQKLSFSIPSLPENETKEQRYRTEER